MLSLIKDEPVILYGFVLCVLLFMVLIGAVILTRMKKSDTGDISPPVDTPPNGNTPSKPGDGVGPSPPEVIKTLEHIQIYGQSNAMGSAALPEETTGTDYPANLTCPKGGPRIMDDTFVPTFEGVNGKYGETSGSSAITAYYERSGKDPNHFVSNSVHGMGGQRIDQLTVGTKLYANMKKRMSKASAQRIKLGASSFNVAAWCWVQGESDNVTPGNKYRDALEKLIENVKTYTSTLRFGTNEPTRIILCQISMFTPDDSPIPQVQLDMENDGLLSIACPMYPLTFTPNNIHLSAFGQRQMGAYFARALSYMKKGEEPPATRIIEAKIENGTDLLVTLKVHKPPVVLDEKYQKVNYGFNVDGGDIANISVASPTTIRIKTQTVLKPGSYLRYAYSPDTIATIIDEEAMDSRCVGGVRDSCEDKLPMGLQGGDKSSYDRFRMHNWLPHCKVIIN